MSPPVRIVLLAIGLSHCKHRGDGQSMVKVGQILREVNQVL